MSILKQRAQVACEIEAEEGTAETLEAADAFLALNPNFEPVIEAHERNAVASSLSPFPSVFGARSARLTFDVELAGTAAAGDAVPYSDALQACGISETLVSETSATYAPASSSVPSVTLGYYLDGIYYKLWGARGTARLVLEAGKPGIISFEFLAADYSVSDVALLSGVTLTTIKGPAFQSASLTIDSFAALVSKLEIDLGNSLVLRPDASASSSPAAGPRSPLTRKTTW